MPERPIQRWVLWVSLLVGVSALSGIAINGAASFFTAGQKVTGMETRLTAAETQITSLVAALQEATKALAESGGRLSRMELRWDDLQQDRMERREITGASIASLGQRLTEVEKDSRAANAQADRNTQAITGLQAEGKAVKDAIAALDGRISELSAQQRVTNEILRRIEGTLSPEGRK